MSDNDEFKRLLTGLTPVLRMVKQDNNITPGQWITMRFKFKVDEDGTVHVTDVDMQETPKASSPPPGSH